MNNAKNAMRLMNGSKNKLNNEIIFIFHPNPNTHLVSVWQDYFCQLILLFS